MESWEGEYGLPVTVRSPRVETHANWVLSMYELFLREPTADRYAVFQDDFVTVRNLRAYLEKAPYPDHGYCNLYTMHTNEECCRGGRLGWVETPPVDWGQRYHGKLQQRGLGAVALVFSREAVQTLLSGRHLVDRSLDVAHGKRKVDGGIVETMNKAGWWEFCHSPSLVQHTGDVSTMGNVPHPKAHSFPGEDFDALELLRKGATVYPRL